MHYFIRPSHMLLFLSLALLVACEQERKEYGSYAPKFCRDFDEIIASGKLTALTDLSSTSYFVYRGDPMGFEYELLERFAKHIGVRLEVRVVEDLDNIIRKLNKGKGDVIAANFTVTGDRKERVAFSEPVMDTRQVLIQRLPKDAYKLTRAQLDKVLVRDPSQLANRTVHVRKESSFYHRLKNLMRETGENIDLEPAGDVSTEKLIEMVSTGEIEFTVADENVARLNAGYYRNIDIRTPLSLEQHVAWAVRPSSTDLLDSINTWLNGMRSTGDFAHIHMKYFKARTQHKGRVLSEYSSLKGDRISPYDELIKLESERLNWDWKLLAAVIYQESHFDALAEARSGATGLMQLIPETAARFGADSLTDPAQNIHAGVSFLKSLQDYWVEQTVDTLERLRFVLGSYNVGLGHVLDAQRLAKKYDGNPYDWDSVGSFLELKSDPVYYRDEVVKHGYCRGSEPVNYVEEIVAMWRHYQNTGL